MKSKETNASGGSTTVLWWVGWIVLTILSFFISCYFWTRLIAEHLGPMSRPGVPVIWVAAVFGSWMVLLVPLIVVMYSKVDKSYEDARIARENAPKRIAIPALPYRTQPVKRTDRLLSEELTAKLKKIPQTLRGGHLVTVILAGDRRISPVFIRDAKEIVGVYDVERVSFTASEVIDFLTVDLDKEPPLETEKWLRLDWVEGE